ncbi:MAG TPA: hypothetical protein VFI23_11125 [Rhizomicrobium sp.]|nr:hypothetical protein [Rhizomicrobium sp.]
MRRRLTAVSLCLAATVPAAAQECGQKIASFDLVQADDGSIVIPVMFGDTPGRMGLDFDGLESAVYAKTVDKLHFPVTILGRRYWITWFGQAVNRFAEVPSISIGKAPAHFRAFILDRGEGELDGWLGLSFLGNNDIDIDFPNKKITFFSPNPCPAKQVVTWTDNFQTVPLTEHVRWNFDFPVQIEGHSIQMSLLAGLSTGWVRLPQAEDILGLKTNTPGMRKEPEPDFYSYSFKSLKIAGIDMADSRLGVLWRSQPGCVYDRCWNDQPPGYLSLNQFRAMHIYIAYRAKKMYLSAGDPKPPQTPAISPASPAAH